MFGLKDVLFAEEDDLSGSGSIGDDVALLDQEDEVPEVGEVDEEETEELEEGAEESEEEEEEPHGEIRPHERPTVTDLKKDFPEVLKKFPALRDIIYREKRYDEEFGNIEDAIQAKENSEAFNSLHDDIFQGDGSKFFTAIKDESPEALQKFAPQILPALMKVDEKAHWAAAFPLIELMIKSFAGSEKDNEEVQKAAKLFAKFAFANQAEDVLSGRHSFAPKAEDKKKEIDPEILEYRQEKRNDFIRGVSNSVGSQLESLILERNKSGKVLLDPDGEFSEWLTKAIVKSIKDKVDKQIINDETHQKYVADLWKKAEKLKYAKDAMSSIIDAYLERARPLVRAIRPKEVAEMRGKNISPRRSQEVKEKANRREAGGGGGITKRNGQSNKVDYRKMSDEDIINAD